MKTFTTRIKTLIIVSLFFFPAFLQAQVLFEWFGKKDNGNTDRALIVNRESGYIHVAGTTVRPDGFRLYTRKYNSNGVKLWSRTGNKTLPGPVLFIKRDANLNTFLICQNSGGTYDMIKYGQDAVQKWKKTFSERPCGLEIDGSGKIYTGGQASGGFFARCYRNSDGSVLWARSETLGAEAQGMDIDAGGNVFVGGIDEIDDQDLRIVKFGISSYTTIWANTFNSPGGGRDNVRLLTVDAAGNVYMSGELEAYGSMGANVSMAKFNASGIHQWSRFVTIAGGPSSAHAVRLLMDPLQNPVLVVNKTDFYNVNPSEETDRILVVKCNRNDGTFLFSVYPNDPTYSDPDISENAVCASVDQYGNVYIGGYGNNGGFPFGQNRWTITKVDGVDGHLRWVEAEGVITTGETRVNDIYISSGGSVYLAVTVTDVTPDFWIVKYSQPGGGLRLAENDLLQDDIINNDESQPVKVFPNPSSDKFYLSGSQSGNASSIILFDYTGKIIRRYDQIGESFEFGSDLVPGVYFMNIISGDQNSTIRIVKSE